MSRVEVPTAADFVVIDPLLCQAFDIPGDAWTRFRARVPPTDFRVLRAGLSIRGALGLYRFAQYFGGRSVPSVGVAVVGVPPEHRGTGAGTALMAGTLQGLRAEGIALSSLYPATRRPYRRVGYECAGTRVDWSLPVAAIGLRERGLPAVAVPATAHARFHTMYRHWASAGNGLADRSHTLWERLVNPLDHPAYAYVLGDDEGYVVFYQADAPAPFAFDLVVRDLVALTPAALRRAWTLLADHQSIAGRVRWVGSATDPRLLALPEVGGTADWIEQWMLRIVHLPNALLARGYGSDGLLDLEVVDAVLPDNAGRWRLEVNEGVPTLTSGGRGAVRCDIRGLAALYSGFVSAERGALLGLVEGEASALRAATALFAGSECWLADRF